MSALPPVSVRIYEAMTSVPKPSFRWRCK